MKQQPVQQGHQETAETQGTSSQNKQDWQEPKLTFVEPKLTPHGTLKEMTAQDGFFGTFTP